MKQIYEELWVKIRGNSQRNVEDIFYGFFEGGNTSNTDNLPYDIVYELDSDVQELHYFFRLVLFYTKIKEKAMAFDWTSENLGTFMIKSLLALGKYDSTGKYRDIIVDDAMPKLHSLFTLPGQNASLPDIAYLYAMLDFRTMSKKSLDQTEIKAEWMYSNIPELYTPSSIDGKSSFLNCIQDVAKTMENDAEMTYFEETKKVLQSSFIPAPCKEPKKYPSCNEYCNWHSRFFNKVSKAKFLAIMKHALPQRMLKLDFPGPVEKEMATTIFGEDKVKNNWNHNISSMSMIAFHHQRNKGFTGDMLESSASILDNGFFPSPTHKGFCLSRYLDVNRIARLPKEYDPILLPDIKKTSERIEGGTRWSQMTLAFLPESNDPVGKPFKQGFPRSTPSKVDELEIQLHDSKEFGNFMDNDLKAITLKGGYEYFIEVTPSIRKATNGFRALGVDQRKCLLEMENKDKSSIFGTYKQSNCHYDCHVRLAKEKCQCIPWDYMHKHNEVEECDVFGRTCFDKAMKNPQLESENPCPHCLHDCEFIKFKKQVIREKKLLGKKEGYFKNLQDGNCKGSRNFCNFFLDPNGTFIDKGVRNLLNTISYNDLYQDERSGAPGYPGLYPNMVIVHLIFNEPEMDKADIKYSELDYFANFGGNFGIFVEMTGCSFLGVFNFCILMVKLCCSFSKGKGATKENLP